MDIVQNTNTDFWVGDWLIMPDKKQLQKGAEILSIEARIMEVLCYLHTNRHRIVSIQELIDQVWQGRHVSNHAVYRVINQLRKVLSDENGDDYIVNIPGKGYQLKLVENNLLKKEKISIKEPKISLYKKLEKYQHHLHIVALVFILLTGFFAGHWFNQSGTAKNNVLLEKKQNTLFTTESNNIKTTNNNFQMILDREFKGANDVISISSNDAVNLNSDEFTIEVIFKTNSDYVALLDKREREPYWLGYLLFIREGKPLLQLAAKDSRWLNYFDASAYNAVTFNEMPPVNDGQWHYVAASVKRHDYVSEITIYVDGIKTHQYFSGKIGKLTNDASLKIGGHYEKKYNFKGTIYSVNISKFLKNDLEIGNSFLKSTSEKCASCRLVYISRNKEQQEMVKRSSQRYFKVKSEVEAKYSKTQK